MFDPYQTWLGVRCDEQPPTHYQLLDIKPSEADARTVEEAANRQAKRLQKYRDGEHAKVCARLLKEVAEARAVLLDPAKRKAYDAQLSGKSTAVKPKNDAKKPAPTKKSVPAQKQLAKEKPRGRGRLMIALGLVAFLALFGGTFLVAVVGAYWFDVGGLRGHADRWRHANLDKKAVNDPIDDDGNEKDGDKEPPVNPKDKTPEPPVVKDSDKKSEPPIAKDGDKKPPIDPDPPIVKKMPIFPKKKEQPPIVRLPFEAAGDYVNITQLSDPRPERGPTTAVACSADGRFIAWANGQGTAIYKSATGKATYQVNASFRGARALAFSDDGELFAVASNNHNVYLWKTSGKTRMLVLSHGHAVRCIAFSPDAKFLLTGTEGDNTVRLWDATTGNLVRAYKGHSQMVSAVAFSADGQCILSGARDKIIRWDREEGNPLNSFRADSPFGITDFLRGSQAVLGITNQHPLLLWDLEQNKETRRFPKSKGNSAYSIASSNNGKVAAVGFDKVVQVFDVESGREIGTLAGHQDWVWSLALPADGRFVVAGSKDGTVSLWEKDFVPLFNGKDLTGWKTYLKTGVEDDNHTFTIRDGILTITGEPHGYLYTKASYRNYLIRLDWRYERPLNLGVDRTFQGDSGLLMHISGPPRVWPESVQVQWFHQEFGLIYLVPHQPGKNYTWDKAVADRAMHRVGDWNRTEVLSQDGRITCTLNGVEVGAATGKLVGGQIGLQSEGAPIQFRRVDIKVLP